MVYYILDKDNIHENFEKPVRDYIDKMLLKVDTSIERYLNWTELVSNNKEERELNQAPQEIKCKANKICYQNEQ